MIKIGHPPILPAPRGQGGEAGGEARARPDGAGPDAVQGRARNLKFGPEKIPGPVE